MKNLTNFFNKEQEKIWEIKKNEDIAREKDFFNSKISSFIEVADDSLEKEFILSKQRELNSYYTQKLSEFGKYGAINKYRNKLCRDLDIEDSDSMEIMYSIDTFFECETYKIYETFLKIAEEKRFKRVFDIGCAYGLQSEVFTNTDIEYIGINESKLEFWGGDKHKYVVQGYPFKIEANSTDLAISSLCLTYNCYLYDGEETLKAQCEALSRDFKGALLSMQMDKLGFVAKYFKGYDIIKRNIVYFYN